MECYIKDAKGKPENLVTIIIPCKDIKEIIYQYPEECEIIVVEGKESPGRLRDFGAKIARGKYLAFIDSDAYVKDDWYSRVKYHCQGNKVFCGPGILPPNSSFLEVLSDLVYRCLPYGYRVTPRKIRRVREFPTFNFIVEKQLFNEVGGFDTDMITGEDTILCDKLNTSYHPSIFYFPDVVVYHRRRPFGLPFFKQVSRYGTNRGILIAKAFPLVPIAILVSLIVYLVFFIKGLYENTLSTQ